MTIMKTLVLAILLTGSALATAQAEGRFGHAADCVRLNASRLPGDISCGETEAPPIVIRDEEVVTVRIRTPALESRQCQARVSIGYVQRNTIASVDGEIENDDCAASSGSYTLALSIRGGNGDYERLEFAEDWQRDDDQPVSFAADYPIGENVELVRARVLRVRCLCATEPEPGEAEAGRD